MESTISIASVIGAVLGLIIYNRRQSRRNGDIGAKVLQELKTGKMTVPEILARMETRDTFYNRGKLMNTLNPMVSKGLVIQSEPPGTTMRNRLSLMTFELPAV